MYTWTGIPDMSHDTIWAILLAEVSELHQHHDVSGYVNLTQWWYFFIIFEYILHISTPHIMIFCFPLPYFPLSTSALFFA